MIFDPKKLLLLLSSSPPLQAAYNGSAKCLRMLLDDGARRDIKDMNKRRAINVARFYDHGDAIAVLEDAKSKIAFAMGEE